MCVHTLTHISTFGHPSIEVPCWAAVLCSDLSLNDRVPPTWVIQRNLNISRRFTMLNKVFQLSKKYSTMSSKYVNFNISVLPPWLFQVVWGDHQDQYKEHTLYWTCLCLQIFTHHILISYVFGRLWCSLPFGPTITFNLALGLISTSSNVLWSKMEQINYSNLISTINFWLFFIILPLQVITLTKNCVDEVYKQLLLKTPPCSCRLGWLQTWVALHDWHSPLRNLSRS